MARSEKFPWPVRSKRQNDCLTRTTPVPVVSCAPEGGSVKESLRLLGYARRYWFLLVISVVLMAIFGAMTAARVLLIKEVLGRVLQPGRDATPDPLFRIPVIDYPIYLEHFFPQSIHNIFTVVAIAIAFVFAVRGLCDYLGDYLTNIVGFSVVTDLRNQVFEKVL